MSVPIKAHIFVVDDDESMRFILERKLFQSGYSVTVAVTGAHAIQILQSGKHFDLLICDLKMPTKSGLDVLKFMREQSLEIATIVMTGFPDRDKIITAAQLGVQDVIVKPIKLPDLMKMIESKLSGGKSGVQAS